MKPHICSSCGRVYQGTEGKIDGVHYCHPPLSEEDTCYMEALSEAWKDFIAGRRSGYHGMKVVDFKS